MTAKKKVAKKKAPSGVKVFRPDKGEITIPKSDLDRYEQSGWKVVK